MFPWGIQSKPPAFMRGFLFSLMILTAGLSAAPDFAKAVRPVLERRCFSCHGPKEQKGKLRLDTLSTDLVQDARAAEMWQEVRAAVSYTHLTLPTNLSV